MPTSVTVCVGSSCHVRGAREVLKRFAELVKQNGLEDEVVLYGSFCMDRCGEGMNWRIGDEDVTSASVAEAEAEFRHRLIDVPRKA